MKTRRCRKPAYWQTYSALKVTEGGPGQRWMVQELKSAGFKHVQPIQSCYVGHTAVRVLASTARHRRASRILYGK